MLLSEDRRFMHASVVLKNNKVDLNRALKLFEKENYNVDTSSENLNNLGVVRGL